MNPYKSLNVRKSSIHSPSVIMQSFEHFSMFLQYLVSLVSCTSTAEIKKNVKNTWFWGEEAGDKHPFCGKQQCHVGWRRHQLNKGKKGARVWK